MPTAAQKKAAEAKAAEAAKADEAKAAETEAAAEEAVAEAEAAPMPAAADGKAWYRNGSKSNVFTTSGRCGPNETVQLDETEAKQCKGLELCQ